MNQKGIAHLQLIAIAAIVLVGIIFTGVKVMSKNTAKVASTSNSMASSSKKSTSKSTQPANTSATNQATTSTTTPATVRKSGSSAGTGSPSSSASSSSSSGSSTQTPAPSNPTIGSLTPANGTTVTGNLLTYDCTYSTPAGFSKLIVNTTDQNGQVVDSSEQDIGSAGCWQQSDSTYMPDGQYTSTFTVYDVNGKTASASTTYTISH